MARRSCITLRVIGLALLLTACTASDQQQAALSFKSCRLPQLATAAQCATLEAPKNRQRPEAGALTLSIARLPANTTHPEPDPLILLAGGPGQAASALAPFAAALVDIRRNRDILMIDARGTGRSSPLHCDALDSSQEETLEDALSTDSTPRAAQCFEQLKAQSIDPLDYGTMAVVADLEAVRHALGLKTVNLWAGSYGTRVALEYLRQYSDHVRTLTLDGVMPPSMRVTLDAWRSRDARLDTLLTACAQSSSCRQLQPPLPETLDLLAKQLATPRSFTFNEPRTGNTQTLKLDFDNLLSALQPLLYAPDSAALIPEVLHAALSDDIAPLLALAQSFASSMDGQINPALYYAITCAEDVPNVRADERASLNTLRSQPLARQSFDACAGWPAAILPPEWGTPVHNAQVPVLLLSGALDPVTPPARAEEAAQTLAHHRNIVADGYGHIVSTQSCAPQLLASLVKTASLDALPASCINTLENSAPPPLWSNRLAPAF